MPKRPRRTPPHQPQTAEEELSEDLPPAFRLRPAPSVPASSRPGGPEHWEVVIGDDFSDKPGELCDRLVDLPRRSRGVIWFDSGGGSVYTGLALASLIRLRGLRATGVVPAECSSAALLPFAACERRLVTPHATLLFHPGRWTSEQDIRTEEASEWARHFAQMEEGLDELLTRLFGCERQLLDRWNRPGKYVTGQEIVEAGLADMVTLDQDLWRQL